MASTYSDFVHLYVPSPMRDSHLATINGHWDPSVVSPTPGPVTAELPKLMTFPDALPLSFLFEDELVTPGEAPATICDLHRRSKLKKPVTVVREGYKKKHVLKPIIKEDLDGGLPVVDGFWSLCSLILDLGSEHTAAALCTGEYWEPQREAIRILSETAKSIPDFQTLYEKHAQTKLASILAGELVFSQGCWDFTTAGVYNNAIASYIAGQLADYLRELRKEVLISLEDTTVKVIVKVPTCGVTPNPALQDYETTLPEQSARFASSVLSVLDPFPTPSTAPSSPAGQQATDFSDYSREALHRRVGLYSSPSVMLIAQAMLVELQPLTVAHGLRRTYEHMVLPHQVFSLAATLAESRLEDLRSLPQTNNMSVSDPADEGTLSPRQIHQWALHTESIRRIVQATPDVTKQSILEFIAAGLTSSKVPKPAHMRTPDAVLMSKLRLTLQNNVNLSDIATDVDSITQQIIHHLAASTPL